MTVYNIPFIFDYFIVTSVAFGNLEQFVINEVGDFLKVTNTNSRYLGNGNESAWSARLITL